MGYSVHVNAEFDFGLRVRAQSHRGGLVVQMKIWSQLAGTEAGRRTRVWVFEIGKNLGAVGKAGIGSKGCACGTAEGAFPGYGVNQGSAQVKDSMDRDASVGYALTEKLFVKQLRADTSGGGGFEFESP